MLFLEDNQEPDMSFYIYFMKVSIDLPLSLCHNIDILMTRHHQGWCKEGGSQEEVLLDGHWSQV